MKKRGDFFLKYEKRLAVLYVLLICLFTFTVFRLYVISESTAASQVLYGQYSRNLPITSRRGFIYDRNGNSLNATEDGCICVVDPEKCENPGESAKRLSELSGKLLSEITEKMLRKTPFVIRISEPYSTQGVYSFPYYNKEAVCAPHIIGYTNKDGKGMSGIEKIFNAYLSGDFSGSVSYSYSADALGTPLSGVGSTLTDKGYSESSGVYTTLDSKLQQFCEAVAEENIPMGAVCVSDIETGELLASVSLPSFDAENIVPYLESDRGELINRCAAGFTPGSIFKVIVAAAALELDSSLYELEYECPGSYTLYDGTKFSCHEKNGHGMLSMKEAFANSCNPYFINLAQSIGIDRVLDTAKKMGVGEKSELYAVCSYSGKLPQIRKDDEGFSANIAIGQGSLLVCPYEALNVYSCAAVGFYCKPFVISHVNRGEYLLESYKSKKIKVLSEKTCQKLREMMLSCTKDGLGKEAMPSGGDAGGKTATAQTGQYKDGKEILNSWFCGVYPISSPKYVICVLCDGNEKGGNPRIVFREICEYLSESGSI